MPDRDLRVRSGGPGGRVRSHGPGLLARAHGRRQHAPVTDEATAAHAPTSAEPAQGGWRPGADSWEQFVLDWYEQTERAARRVARRSTPEGAEL